METKVNVSNVARVVRSETGFKVLSEDPGFCAKLARNPNLPQELWYKVLDACASATDYAGIAALAFTAKTAVQVDALISEGGAVTFRRIATDPRYEAFTAEVRGALEANAMFMAILKGVDERDRINSSEDVALGSILATQVTVRIDRSNEEYVLEVVSPRLDALGEAGWLMFAGELPGWKDATEVLLETIERTLLS